MITLLTLLTLLVIFISFFISYQLREMTKAIGSSRVTQRYQATIPKEVRDIISVEIGDLLIFFQKEGDIVIRTSITKTNIPSSDYNKVNDISDDLVLFESNDKSTYLLWKWFNTEKSDGKGINLRKEEILTLVEIFRR